MNDVRNPALQERIRKVCKAFRIPGVLQNLGMITRGNINTTYRADFLSEKDGPDGKTTAETKSYLVQKVNSYVFKHPEQIMQNIDRVTTCIMEKCGDAGRLHFHHTEDGKNYFIDGDSFWRLSNFIDSVTFDECRDLRVLEGTGRAFGQFQSRLADFDATLLYETIPDFHHTGKRMKNFLRDVEEDPLGRVCEVREEISFIVSQREQVTKLSALQEEGRLPLRVTHNDTKVNNVLFHKETLEPITVIDLDTVMPGLAMYDFGDAVRFAANTAVEDEEDLSKVSLDLEKFRALTVGYIGAAAKILTKDELDTMALGALTLTVELGMRFLDDYITGDLYFKTRYPGHNLVRARCQLCLAKDMLSKFDEMDRIVHEVAQATMYPPSQL